MNNLGAPTQDIGVIVRLRDDHNYYLTAVNTLVNFVHTPLTTVEDALSIFKKDKENRILNVAKYKFLQTWLEGYKACDKLSNYSTPYRLVELASRIEEALYE